MDSLYIHTMSTEYIRGRVLHSPERRSDDKRRLSCPCGAALTFSPVARDTISDYAHNSQTKERVRYNKPRLPV